MTRPVASWRGCFFERASKCRLKLTVSFRQKSPSFATPSELLIPSEPGSTMRSVLIELASICSDTQIHSRLTGAVLHWISLTHGNCRSGAVSRVWCKELTASGASECCVYWISLTHGNCRSGAVMSLVQGIEAFCFAVCDRSPVLMDSHDRCIDHLHRSIMSGGSASPIWSQTPRLSISGKSSHLQLAQAQIHWMISEAD